MQSLVKNYGFIDRAAWVWNASVSNVRIQIIVQIILLPFWPQAANCAVLCSNVRADIVRKHNSRCVIGAYTVNWS